MFKEKNTEIKLLNQSFDPNSDTTHVWEVQKGCFPSNPHLISFKVDRCTPLPSRVMFVDDFFPLLPKYSCCH